MKNISIITSLLLTLALTACSNTQSNEKESNVKFVENPTIQAKGMEQIKTLLKGHLKPAIMGEMKSDKTGVAGMTMCSTEAKTIVANYNKTLPEGSKVRRTALKYRNPANKPDATDVAVMNELKAKKNFKPVVVELEKSFRVYKALDVKKPCLACHGASDTLNSGVKELITKNYPKDLATEFKEGDFRGVVVSEIAK